VNTLSIIITILLTFICLLFVHFVYWFVPAHVFMYCFITRDCCKSSPNLARSVRQTVYWMIWLSFSWTNNMTMMKMM